MGEQTDPIMFIKYESVV